MIVMKFGGSSVAGAEKIARVAGVVRGRLARKPVLVVSAFRGTTDDLLALARESLTGDVSRLDAIARRHREAAAELGVDAKPLEPLFDELAALARGISLLKELTPRTLDRVASFGERLSARLIAAAFAKAGIPARAVDAFDAGLLTDERFGAAAPLPEAERELKQYFAKVNVLSVVTGFVGRTRAGEITTLGRNGSDYSATIIGAALGAEEIEIWSDTDGIMTADPRLVPAARPLGTLSFAEACELAYYGGKVLHPHTLVPAMAKNIPVRVLNTFKPEHPGTSIVAHPPKAPAGSSILKSIAFKRRQLIVSASSPRMTSGPGFLARIFDAFARHEIDVDMIATSEVSVSATTGSERNVDRAVAELSLEFEMAVERGQAVICAVGDGLQSVPGVAADVFSAVRSAGVNVRMISQGASKNNVAFVVEDADVERAVRALHERFFPAAV
ncbi:MAG TPA: aspartate kinase [Elusimicrobiota bacterium]|nr:aspartate kinase [Elusimicrobiota bacterium]